MKKKNLLFTVIAIFGFAALSMAQTIPTYVPKSGLLGWWPFNGNANDESVKGNNGTVNGATLTIDRLGNANKAYAFDGINNSILCNGLSSYYVKDTMSFSFWINRYNNATNVPENVVCLGGGNVRWGFEASHNRLCLSNGSGCSGTGPGLAIGISLNTWHHIIYVVKGTVQIIYVDGINVGTASGNALLTSLSCSNTNLYFGVNLWGIKYFNGKLDDIGIWSRELSQLEINNLYQGCAISISTQPANQTVNISSSAQFTTVSSDTTVTYQWQTDLGVGFQNLNNVGQYSGATNDTLTVSNVTMSNNNQPFRCIVSSGSCTDTSNIAVLTALCNISVTTQPTNQSVNISNNAQFVVNSSDPSATYQWQTDLGVGFQNLNSVGQYSGTANDTITIANRECKLNCVNGI